MDSFAALFEQSAGAKARAPKHRVGDRVEGRVVQVGRDAIFLDLGGGVQGQLDVVELREADGTIPFKEGDTVSARVIEVDAGRGNVRLAQKMPAPPKRESFNKGGKGDREKKSGPSTAHIEQAMGANVAVEGKVTGINKGGLEVDIGGVRAFCPISQASDRFVEDASSMVNETFKFLVTEVREGGKSVVLSRRALLKQEAMERAAADAAENRGEPAEKNDRAGEANAAKAAEAAIIASIVVNGVVKGTVERIETYGVFLQVEGTKGRGGRGLVPVSELGVPRGTDLKKRFPMGTLLQAKVLEIGEGKLRLSVRGAKDAEEQADFAQHTKKAAEGPRSLGTFADLFKKK